MQVNQVTIFKLMFFVVCVVMITIFVQKLMIYGKMSENQNFCQTLMIQPEVETSGIAEKCPEGFYPNFGEFHDVSDGSKCCVKYVVK